MKAADPDLPAVLLIEDNEDDIFIFNRAYSRAGLRYPIHIVRDGAEAMDYLAGRNGFSDRGKHPLPFLILLDLKLPLHSGLDVLEWMRGQAQLADLPVAILTSSAEIRDIASARRLRAQAYLVKPPTSDMLGQALTAFQPGKPPGAKIKIQGDHLADADRDGE